MLAIRCMAGNGTAIVNSTMTAATTGHFGFDHWLATQNNASPSHRVSATVRMGKAVGEIEDSVVRRSTKRSTASVCDPDRPFFIYAAFHEPHEPVASPAHLVESYQGVSRDLNEAQYFACCNVDAAVGKLLAGLETGSAEEHIDCLHSIMDLRR